MAAAKKKKKPAKPTKKQIAQKEKQMRILKRAGIVFGGVMLLGWAVSWFIISESHIATSNWIKNQTLNITASAGFEIEEILVKGRENTNPDLLMAIINVGQGDPIFLFDPQDAKAKIEEISWVESAHVERRLPGTIYIGLTERVPFALWHNDGVLSVIDVNGTVITKDEIAPFKDLMMIRGEGAAKKAGALLKTLSGERVLYALIDHAELIDKRRWDLLLKDGKRIKLPEKDFAIAMRNIIKHHEQEDILGKESVTDIDARYKGRLIVRTKLGTVQDYISNSDEVGTRL